MSRNNYLFTSESVSEGHPDKLCDRVSDSILDAFLSEEALARVACETFATTNRVVVGGEVGLSSEEKLKSFMDKIDGIVRDCVKDIGYEQDGFHWQNLTVHNYLHPQSAHIAQGVDNQGAGDQGIMFGYAVNETEALMPAPIQYSHAILRNLAKARKTGELPQLGPDAKSQLTVCYENGKPVGVTSIVLSSQHLDEKLSSEDVKELVKPYIMNTLPDGWVSDETEWHVNPTGAFVIGGPDGDAGLTGRKIIVDTYGGAAPHGGGAFSGKDPTKVDRSAAYAARYIAKNVVASKISEKCLIQLAYAIGVSKPLSIYVDLFDNDLEKNKFVVEKINENFDLSPRGIREMLNLNKPIYEKTAAYGHFGRTSEKNGSFSWEKIDKINVFSK